MLRCKGMLCLLWAALSPGCPLWGLGGPDRAGHIPSICSPTQQRGWGCSAWVMPSPRRSPGGSGASVSPPRELSSPQLCPLGFWGAAAGRGSPWCCSGDGEEVTGSGGSVLLEISNRQHCRAQWHPPKSHEVPNAQSMVGDGHHLLCCIQHGVNLRMSHLCSGHCLAPGDPGTGVTGEEGWLLGFLGTVGTHDPVVSAEEREGGTVAEADELLPEVEEAILQAAGQDTLLRQGCQGRLGGASSTLSWRGLSLQAQGGAQNPCPGGLGLWFLLRSH